MPEIDIGGVTALLRELYGESGSNAALKRAAELLREGHLREAAKFARIAADMAEAEAKARGESNSSE